MSDPTREELARAIDPAIYPHINRLNGRGWTASLVAADAVLALIAPALRAARAEAWHEGYQQGYCVEPRPDWANAHSNPYRQEADQ